MGAAVCALLAALVLSGCGTVHFDVPRGGDFRLMGPSEPAAVKVDKKIWFWLWGARTITDNHADVVVREHGLREVRYELKNSFGDTVLGIPLGIVSIAVRTLTVEGNR